MREQHLLDGDPASKNLSPQWIASTFSHKPYFINCENMERFTGSRYCADWPLYGKCAFEGSCTDLERRPLPKQAILFPAGEKTASIQ